MLGGITRPSAGRVLLEGVDLAVLDDDALAIVRRRRIGFVFQRYNLLPELSLLENVALPLVLDGRGDTESDEAARVALEAVTRRLIESEVIDGSELREIVEMSTGAPQIVPGTDTERRPPRAPGEAGDIGGRIVAADAIEAAGSRGAGAAVRGHGEVGTHRLLSPVGPGWFVARPVEN
jgi:hypothetical protein